MSVEIRKQEAVIGNHLVIISNDSMLYGYEDIQNRITAIIDAIRNMDEQMMTKQTIYPLLDILKDYLPTDEQWQKIFED